MEMLDINWICATSLLRDQCKKTKHRNSEDTYISYFDFTKSEATYTHRRLCSARHFCGGAEDERRAAGAGKSEKNEKKSIRQRKAKRTMKKH